ncbi:hypothetical protein B0H15DRAFT_271422 [Mycena belliarum]|uniref:Uncharacterized protein n=1 Tax=Mycena belliarum TaxID=1033014 RepID=A0AAD6U6L1_9AGAR|nr:hypothetical protein B0H15DRAFT_271422 [Mycena belliae]
MTRWRTDPSGHMTRDFAVTSHIFSSCSRHPPRPSRLRLAREFSTIFLRGHASLYALLLGFLPSPFGPSWDRLHTLLLGPLCGAREYCGPISVAHQDSIAFGLMLWMSAECSFLNFLCSCTRVVPDVQGHILPFISMLGMHLGACLTSLTRRSFSCSHPFSLHLSLVGYALWCI